jgi:hypothetical protein
MGERSKATASSSAHPFDDAGDDAVPRLIMGVPAKPTFDLKAWNAAFYHRDTPRTVH